jgi:hypothetical protein
MLLYLQRVYWWFHNHTRGSSGGTDARNTLKLSTKSRTLQPFQAYSRLYYEIKLKDVINVEFEEHTKTVPKHEQKTRFVFSTALTKTLYEAETEEVKKEVEVYRKKQTSSCAIKLEEDEGEDDPMDEDELDERNQQMQA